MILLTPGPCMTSETVRLAAALPDLNHRDPEYRSLVREVKDRLLHVYTGFEDWVPYLIGGSGTAAVEAMITSCIERGPALILENGYYSGRLREIFEIHGIPHESLAFGWLEPWGFGRIEDRLREGEFEAVLGTHNETTTGRLNDVARLGALCRQYGARCVVDAISSFGADPLDPQGLDVVVASANKCLHGIPGISFVLVKRPLAEQIRSFARRTYYLSLPMYEGDDPPLTPSVPALAALRQALRELGQGGADARGRRYLSQCQRLRNGLEASGLRPVVDLEDSSRTLVTVPVPSGYDADGWLAENRERGFVLYGCKGELRERCFQVSNMGEVTDAHLEAWLELLRTMA